MEIRARPGSSREEIVHDPWRKVWTVAVREPPLEGQANRAILSLLSRALQVSATDVVWVVAGRSRSKRVKVLGLTADEVDRRLKAVQAASSSGGPAKR